MLISAALNEWMPVDILNSASYVQRPFKIPDLVEIVLVYINEILINFFSSLMKL